jgi:hypothetical protein
VAAATAPRLGGSGHTTGRGQPLAGPAAKRRDPKCGGTPHLVGPAAERCASKAAGRVPGNGGRCGCLAVAIAPRANRSGDDFF